MRARLLDLGEVGPVRSQSAYHGVLALATAADDPVLLLARPAAPLVSLGDAGPGAIDLAAAEAAGLPLVWRRTGGPAELLDDNDLLVQLVAPAEALATDAVRDAAAPVLALLAELGIAARRGAEGVLETASGRLGRVQAAVVEPALCLAYSLTWNGPARRPAALAGGSTTSVAAQTAEPPHLAAVAEKLLTALEDHFALELIPSLPTPGELEAIYHWDAHLLLDAAAEPPRTATTLQ